MSPSDNAQLEGDDVQPPKQPPQPEPPQPMDEPEPPKPMDEGPVIPPGFIWDQSSGRFKKAPVL